MTAGTTVAAPRPNTSMRHFGFLLKDVSRLYSRNFERHAAALGLTLNQCKVLSYLQHNEGISQSRLAELTDTDPMTLVRLLDRMAADGLIERRVDPADGRAHCLYLSPGADGVLAQIWRHADRSRAESVAGVSPADCAQLVQLMQRMHANLDALMPGAADKPGRPARSCGFRPHWLTFRIGARGLALVESSKLRLRTSMTPTFQRLRALCFAATAALALHTGFATTLKIGVVPGAYADSVNTAAKEAKKRGIDVQVVEFTDWTTPNVALNAGDLDANYFQHQPFLSNVVAKQGYKLKAVGTGILANFGLYSLKHKTLAEVPVGGKVGIANDPVNQGRGLLLLQKAGLLELKPGVGFLGSIRDITSNPKKLSFVEVEGPQLARITGDVDIALGYPHFIVASKAFDASSGLAYTGVEDLQFAIRFVAREDKAENPDLKKFIEIYQTAPEVRSVINKAFNNDSRLYLLAWLNAPAAK